MLKRFTKFKITNLYTKKAVDKFLNRKTCVHKNSKIDNIKCCKKKYLKILCKKIFSYYLFYSINTNLKFTV